MICYNIRPLSVLDLVLTGICALSLLLVSWSSCNIKLTAPSTSPPHANNEAGIYLPFTQGASQVLIEDTFFVSLASVAL